MNKLLYHYFRRVILAIIGIDLGTTNSIASVWVEGKSVLIPNSFGEPVEESVISVPAYFDDWQRYSTKLARQLVGIHVERIINEPITHFYLEIAPLKEKNCKKSLFQIVMQRNC